MEKLERVLNIVKKWTLNLAMLALAVMTSLVGIEVFLRMFKTSTLIADEYSGYFMVVIIFLGAIASFSDGKFVQMTALKEKFSKNLNIFFDFIFKIILIGYLCFLGVFIWEMNWNSIKFDSRSFSVMRTPLYIPQLFMSIGLLLFIIFLVSEFFVKILQKGRKK
jgi:TRAP-type C4-dicarboxylate transport system permease small subunit